ncbi:transmembrane protein 201 isoform X1 [Girardinichthys multiradiatus]|uniref:transmembrane protein 201 isoform X1 n=1 Tax=Girardinichthys multiradiatus TaxID=208333 RepID=UPI001FAC073E|nr:transmembrane protein 201 isoform X1 [Girardinichthys multiradiatus]
MEKFNMLLFEYPQLMYGGVGATAFVAGGALIYKIATRKKPAHANVNCWFCNQNTVVPYGNRNCWDCPNCDQYNGFQENGDYNKPIPAQYMEHLNHGVSGSLPSSETPATLQWVNCQMLLCRKCNNNQTAKIKQLASYVPRDDDKYDEEIEAYKHHLEQTYKLCRPCQAAVEYYIKYQNRQLRTRLLNHPLRCSRELDSGFVKSSDSQSSPTGVVLLRALAFLICAFLLASFAYKLPEQPLSPNGPQTSSGGVIPPKPESSNESTANNDSTTDLPVWQGLLEFIPDKAVENAKLVWQHGRDNQLAIVSVGLMTCLTAIFLAGPMRLRRIDAIGSVMWFVVLCLYLAESYLANTPSWMDTVKLVNISLCCLVGLAAAAATRKPPGQRRAKYRRYLAGSSAVPPFSSQLPPFHPPDGADPFILTPPPYISELISRQHGPRERKASPSTLPGRLSRALCLGTVPSLTRTGSGYLFSGSRPASQYKDSTSSDYFSLKSGSRPSSPGPSPTPSLAGSFTSSSGSARQRRPLISPARLNITGQKLRLFSCESHPKLVSPPVSSFPFYVEPTPSIYSGCFSRDISPFQSQNDLSSLIKNGSVIEEEKRSSSSGSSACQVGTTTQSPESFTAPKGFVKHFIYPSLLLTSLTANLLFGCFYLYHRWG